jgi:hypothetical protein
MELAYWTTQVSLGIIPVVNSTHLFRMLLVVQTQTPDSPHILRCQGSEQETNIRDLVRYFMLSKNLALDDPSLLGLCNI